MSRNQKVNIKSILLPTSIIQIINNKIIPIGQKIKLTVKIASNTRRTNNRKTSTIITNVFTNIPIPIEKPIKPFLYSFFQGKKNVFIRSGRENNCKKALFREAKNAIKFLGDSTNQNLKNIKGRLK